MVDIGHTKALAEVCPGTAELYDRRVGVAVTSNAQNGYPIDVRITALTDYRANTNKIMEKMQLAKAGPDLGANRNKYRSAALGLDGCAGRLGGRSQETPMGSCSTPLGR